MEGRKGRKDGGCSGGKGRTGGSPAFLEECGSVPKALAPYSYVAVIIDHFMLLAGFFVLDYKGKSFLIYYKW